MNANPSQSTSDVRADLARLLPAPAERDLSSDRHRLLQEFVMTQIHNDQPAAERAPRRAPRRQLILASALTAAAAATAAVVVIGVGGSGGAGGGSAPVSASAAGRQILLAAASTAEKSPAASGTYWYLRTGLADRQWESWTRRDGRTWVRGPETSGRVTELTLPIHPRERLPFAPINAPFQLGGQETSFAELQKLPTEPDALKRWIAESVRTSDIQSSAGKLDAATQEVLVFNGLLSLVSQLPAPPKVRAAAFRAIAAYPEVERTGPTEGGEGLLIRLRAEPKGRPLVNPAVLVVDPTTSQIRKTNFFVTAGGAQAGVVGGDGMYTLTAEWTDRLPG